MDGYAADLSVFARSFDLVGPEAHHYDASTDTHYSNRTQLDHVVGGLLDRNFIPELAASAALPNTGSSSEPHPRPSLAALGGRALRSL